MKLCTALGTSTDHLGFLSLIKTCVPENLLVDGTVFSFRILRQFPASSNPQALKIYSLIILKFISNLYSCHFSPTPISLGEPIGFVDRFCTSSGCSSTRRPQIHPLRVCRVQLYGTGEWADTCSALCLSPARIANNSIFRDGVLDRPVGEI